MKVRKSRSMRPLVHGCHGLVLECTPHTATHPAATIEARPKLAAEVEPAARQELEKMLGEERE